MDRQCANRWLEKAKGSSTEGGPTLRPGNMQAVRGSGGKQEEGIPGSRHSAGSSTRVGHGLQRTTSPRVSTTKAARRLPGRKEPPHIGEPWRPAWATGHATGCPGSGATGAGGDAVAPVPGRSRRERKEAGCRRNLGPWSQRRGPRQGSFGFK